jgi:hypothetical protein
MRQPEQRSSVKSRGRCLLRGLAAIGHEVRALAIATRITLRDHIALVRQHADGSFWVRMSGDRLVPPSYRSGDLRAARARADTGGSTSDSADVSEFRHRILMQRPASPFVISNAMRGTWLGAGTPPSGGPDRVIHG